MRDALLDLKEEDDVSPQRAAFPMMRTLPGLGPQRSPFVLNELLPALPEVDRLWEAMLEDPPRPKPVPKPATGRYTLGVLALGGLLFGAAAGLALDRLPVPRAHAAALELVPTFSSAVLYNRTPARVR
jgi:hypothetical protein